MKSIFDEFYDGRINPAENVVLKNERFDKAYDHYSNLYDELNDRLSKEDQRLLDKIMDAHSVTEDLYYQEYFRVGVITGFRFMFETFAEIMQVES